MDKELERELEFEKCCEEHMPIVYHFIAKWNLNVELEEYVQIGRIALYEAWCNFDSATGKFAPFAYSHVSGKLKKALKKQGRWSKVHHFLNDRLLEKAIEASGNWEDQSRFEMTFEECKLSNREKLWVVEGLIHGYKPREIAEIYGTSVHTVKKWRMHAISKIRNTYGDDLLM